MIGHQGNPHIPHDLPKLSKTPQNNNKKWLTLVMMIAAFIGLAVLGWFALEESRKPKTLAEVPVLKADTSPMKIEPEDRGGMEIKHRGRKVFDIVSETDTAVDGNEIVILPEAEKAMPRSEIALLPEVAEGELDVSDTVILEPKQDVKLEAVEAKKAPVEQTKNVIESAKAAISKAKETLAAEPKKVEVEPKKVVDKAKVEATIVELKQLKETVSSARKEVEKVTKIASKKLPVPASMKNNPKYAKAVQNPTQKAGEVNVVSSKKSVSGLAKGSYAIQLGSYGSQDSANKGWQLLRKKFPSELATFRNTVRRADLGSKGVFYRLYAGPVASRAQGKSLCKLLAKKKQGCILATL